MSLRCLGGLLSRGIRSRAVGFSTHVFAACRTAYNRFNLQPSAQLYRDYNQFVTKEDTRWLARIAEWVSPAFTCPAAPCCAR